MLSIVNVAVVSVVGGAVGVSLTYGLFPHHHVWIYIAVGLCVFALALAEFLPLELLTVLAARDGR